MPKVSDTEVSATQTYVYPQLDRVVEAQNQEEANSIINKQ